MPPGSGGAPQAQPGSGWPIEVVRFAKIGGPLTKKISLDATKGKLLSDASQCLMNRGTAERAILDGIADLGTLIGELNSHEAISLGALRADLPSSVNVTTKRRLVQGQGGAQPLIARTSEYICYQSHRPAYALLDFDAKGMPQEVATRLYELGGYWQALVAIIPELKDTGRVVRASTSAGLFRTDTREAVHGSNGLHTFVTVCDGTDIERLLKTLHARCWLAELGWMIVGASGQLLERSIVDRMVGAPERLVFEGPPILGALLAQDELARRPIVTEGNILDTRIACRPLSIVEQAKLDDLRAKEAHRLASQEPMPGAPSLPNRRRHLQHA